MKTLFYHPTTSQRHDELHYCEERDFGKIEIIEVTEEEAPECFTMKDFEVNAIFRVINGMYIRNDRFNLWMSREGDDEVKLTQGKFGPKQVRALIEKIIDNKSFANAFNATIYKVGKTLYFPYCEVGELSITQCGNVAFGDWWSLDVEMQHINKRNIPFSKDNFYAQLKEAKKTVAKWTKERGQSRRPIRFSYPRIKFNQ